MGTFRQRLRVYLVAAAIFLVLYGAFWSQLLISAMGQNNQIVYLTWWFQGHWHP